MALVEAKASLSSPILVEVVFSPEAAVVVSRTLRLPAQSTVRDAVQQSQCLADVHALEGDDAVLGVGVWGKRVALTHLLRDGDRVEIYRPLKADPKEARRTRYRAQGDRARSSPARKR